MDDLMMVLAYLRDSKEQVAEECLDLEYGSAEFIRLSGQYTGFCFAEKYVQHIIDCLEDSQMSKLEKIKISLQEAFELEASGNA